MLAFDQRHARLLIYGCLALGVGLSLLLWPGRSDDADPYASALIAAHTRKMAADEKALGESRASVVHDSVTVSRTIVRYQTVRDTLDLHDTVQVKVFVAKADSVVRACTELQSSCALFRVRADSVIADLHVENDALRAEVKALHPSRLGTAWARIRLPLAFVGGVYVGSRIVR